MRDVPAPCGRLLLRRLALEACSCSKRRTEVGVASKAAGAGRGRSPGRPRVEIDLDAVADAVVELYDERGFDGVSVVSTAEKLGVSRATLYRTVPTKEHLLGLLFERSMTDLTRSARLLLRDVADPQQRLHRLVDLHVHAAIRMRHHMTVFFGGSGLPPDVYARWHRQSRQYERIWRKAVAEAMDAGVLPSGDARVATRLLLGMFIWISRWYRPEERISPELIAETAIRLLDGHDAGSRLRTGS